MPREKYYLPPRTLTANPGAELTEPPRVPRSRFRGSFNRLTTFNAGDVVPFLVEDVLPGDHLRYRVTALVRMATPLFPLFASQHIDTFFFFVPYRILWANWVKMMGEQTNPGDTINYVVPVVVVGSADWTSTSIWDQFGLPAIPATKTLQVTALPARAYYKIFDDWFRDQNLANSIFPGTGDGPDTASNYVIFKRGKFHDYFTTQLPWTQKFTAPLAPLTGAAPVYGIGFNNQALNVTGTAYYETPNSVRANPFAYADSYVTSTANKIAVEQDAVTGNPKIFADLATTTVGFAINAFRQAFMIQSLMERDARGGTRYTELLRSHFGVINPDFRLQRSEYIGGGSTPLQVTPVAQTATGGTGVGALGAAATAAGQHTASYAATEHGVILGLINVHTELAYQQGVPRYWTKRSRYDFYWPSLAMLGEQQTYIGELYFTGGVNDFLTVFGYQERWHEYRTRYNEVAGMFRSSAVGTIDVWHLAQQFGSAPVLNQSFITDQPPMTRVLSAGAAADKMQYLADIHIERDAVRPIPMFGTPAQLGRF